jgi:type II secretory pathway pseudopilin PulG
MKFWSTGTPARSRSIRSEPNRDQAGYMLLEALVALALVLTFAAALGPVLFQARRIMDGADDRIAAQAMLRSLLDVELDRAALAKGAREGETAGLRWRIAAAPMQIDIPSMQRRVTASGEGTATPSSQNPGNPSGANVGNPAGVQDEPSWAAYRVVASVSWGDDHSITAETVRLGKPQ